MSTLRVLRLANNTSRYVHKLKLNKRLLDLVIKRQFSISSIKVEEDLKPSKEQDYLSRIIYNEVLWKLKLTEGKREKNTKMKTQYDLKKSVKPIFLNFLEEDSNVSQENALSSHIVKENDSKIFHLPYKTTEKYVEEAVGNSNILDCVPRNVANLTPSDDLKIPPPSEWILDSEANYSKNQKPINDNIEAEMKLGTHDPRIPISEVPCGGCGALLHCNVRK